MFRIFAFILLAVAFVLQSFNKPFILMDYYSHTASYEQHCVNKAKPALHCHGKCQMMKKMQEADENNAGQENTKQPQPDILICVALPQPIQPLSTSTEKLMMAGAERLHPARLFAFFHPPRV